MPEFGIVDDVRVNGALNGSGNCVKLKPKFVSIVSACVDRAAVEERLRALAEVAAGLVVVELLAAAHERDGHTRCGCAERDRAAAAVLVRAVEAVERAA